MSVVLAEPVSLPRHLWSKARAPIAGRALLAGLLAVLMFGPLAFGAVEEWAIFVLELSAAALLCLWIARWLLAETASPLGNPLFVPLAFLAMIVIFQLAFHVSANWYATFSAGLRGAALYILFFVAVQVFARRENISLFTVVITAFGAALAFFSILTGFSSPQKIYGLRVPQDGGWIYGPYVNHSHYSGLMEMLTPFALVFALREDVDARRRWLWSLAAMLMGASIFLSGSRGGMVTFSIQIIITAALAFRGNKSRGISWTAAAAIWLFVIFVLWLGADKLAERARSLESPRLPAATRLQIDADTLKMWAARPWLGWGLATFSWVYPQYRSFFSDDHVNAAHNDYLQIAAETGALGLAAIIWFLVVLYRNALRQQRAGFTGRAASARLAAMIGATGIVVHSFFDFNLQIPGNAAMFFCICALATAKGDPHGRT